MLFILFPIVACNTSPKDVVTMDDVIYPTDNNEPESEPDSDPESEPEPEPDTDSLPEDYEDPDAFSSTCGSAQMANNIEVIVNNQTYLLNEAIWDIELFGFMVIVLGDSEGSLCDHIQSGNYSQIPFVELLALGDGLMSSTETYDATFGVTMEEPNEDASVSFESGTNSEIFTSGLIEVESYTYGANMTLNIFAENDNNTVSGTNVTACYCPDALEIIADF